MLTDVKWANLFRSGFIFVIILAGVRGRHGAEGDGAHDARVVHFDFF
jgi:hypothetical protein